MNIFFPTVYVPEDLTWLNSVYLNNSRKSYNVIAEEVYKKPFLKLNVDKLFKSYMKAGSIETVLGALGWKGFRDRLSSSYLYHYFHGFFPDEDEIENIEDVVVFESELDGIFPEGNSRVFFLGFFLKMCEVYAMKNNGGNFRSFLSLSVELKAALQLGNQKVLKPDWLVLSLMHFEKFLGKDNLLDAIYEDKGCFIKLQKRLSDEQTNLMIENFLRYGASLNDQDIFTFEKV